MGLAAALAACAAKPESIKPAYVSEVSYQGWSCEQLGQEQHRLAAALASTSDQQTRARNNDKLGVVFLGLPVSSLPGGNVASEVARLKGEQEALQRAAIVKNCSGR